jgi:hypothetical protein
MPGPMGTKSAAFAIALGCMAFPGAAAATDIDIRQAASRMVFMRYAMELQSCAPPTANEVRPQLSAMKSTLERLSGGSKVISCYSQPLHGMASRGTSFAPGCTKTRVLLVCTAQAS